ncbi:hypothetical protein MLD38_008652 [Melastoma candidum]|uniref:Uncharacterized protein n=1 Tax=Melastoma candidum TaxID=119954 RepID=A0ACB9RU52_9MYRT|nr:hypothetical protein MLD38_008652 [Melastoma candidum]
MACTKKLGSKPDVFRLDGNTWLCSTGLPSDIAIEIGETSFHLHKFPLLSRSRLLEGLIGEQPDHGGGDGVDNMCTLRLDGIPNGAKSFLFVAKFCYGVRIELTAWNVVSLRCAAEYLGMKEGYGEGNLVEETESVLTEVLGSWSDTIRALKTCEEVLSLAEELHIVSRCIASLATKVCVDQTSVNWNGIPATGDAGCTGEDWWYDDVSSLKLDFYKRLITEVRSGGMKMDRIAGSIMYYAKKHLPLMDSQPSAQNHDSSHKMILVEIVEFLPSEKGMFPTSFLLRLLRTSMFMQASPSSSCNENLERRIGRQLDQALLEDLLVPNTSDSLDTLYDIDCFQRILDHFLEEDLNAKCSEITSLDDEVRVTEMSQSLTPLATVAGLVDRYLAEVAADVNLKLSKFQTIAAVMPDYARQIDDGLYRAIDIYIKVHPWLTDSEKVQLCRLMNCQKLSLEASTHAAQNERLPLRVIVQVLFFEQLRLRTSVAGWFFVSETLDNLQNTSRNLMSGRPNMANPRNSEHIDTVATVDGIRDRVYELEKECSAMKQDLEKLVRTKGTWNRFFQRFAFRLKKKSVEAKPGKPSDFRASESPTAPLISSKERCDNGRVSK